MTSTWGVIFDLDGTIVDNHGEHESAWIELGRRWGIPIDHEYYLKNIHARTNEVIVKTLFASNGNTTLNHNIADQKEALYRERYRSRVVALDGFHALLADLKRHSVPCAVASNGPAANLEMVLTELGVIEDFTIVLAAEDVSQGKPSPELFLKAAEAMQLPVERCIIFEDSPSGLEAASRCGSPYIVISCSDQAGEPAQQAQGAKATSNDFTNFSYERLATLVS